MQMWMQTFSQTSSFVLHQNKKHSKLGELYYRDVPTLRAVYKHIDTYDQKTRCVNNYCKANAYKYSKCDKLLSSAS